MKKQLLMKSMLILTIFLFAFTSCNKDDEAQEEQETEETLQSVTITKIVIERFNERLYDVWDPEGTCCGDFRPDVAVQILSDNIIIYESEALENTLSPIIYDTFGNETYQGSGSINIIPSTPINIDKDKAVDNLLTIRIVDIDTDGFEIIHSDSNFGSTDFNGSPIYHLSTVWREDYLSSNLGHTIGVYFTHTFN